MRKTLTTVALMLALCCTAFAGEMSTPPVASQCCTAVAGEMGTPPVAPPDSTQAQSADGNAVVTNSLIQAVLNVIVSVLP